MPYVAPYSATKFAVVGLSENLALELEGTNIGVSVLCPSVVRTRIHESQRNNPTGPAMSKRWKARLDQIGAAVQAGIEPEIVTARALDAIRRKQFYIFTHPESRANIEGRIQQSSIRSSYLNDAATLRLLTPQLQTCPGSADRCTLSATSGLMHCGNSVLLDHLVGADEQCW